jgi:hypothetical protein
MAFTKRASPTPKTKTASLITKKGFGEMGATIKGSKKTTE